MQTKPRVGSPQWRRIRGQTPPPRESNQPKEPQQGRLTFDRSHYQTLIPNQASSASEGPSTAASPASFQRMAGSPEVSPQAGQRSLEPSLWTLMPSLQWRLSGPSPSESKAAAGQWTLSLVLHNLCWGQNQTPAGPGKGSASRTQNSRVCGPLGSFFLMFSLTHQKSFLSLSSHNRRLLFRCLCCLSSPYSPESEPQVSSPLSGSL